MYTQCPHCHESFHVTAEILQQAAGRVRCGACSHVFDALDGLSEAPPEDEPAHGAGPAFRATLDELEEAGNVRIEDTGVEWRVVDDEESDAAEAEDDADASALRWYIHDEPAEPGNDARIPEAAGTASNPAPLELETPTAGEQRYDDNTPLPGLLDGDEEDESPEFPATPRRRAEDFVEPRSSEFDERQVDLALGEPEEWTDLLEEVGDVGEAATQALHAEAGEALELAAEQDDEPTAEHPVIEAAAWVAGLHDDGPESPEPAAAPPELALVDEADEPRVAGGLAGGDEAAAAEGLSGVQGTGPDAGDTGDTGDVFDAANEPGPAGDADATGELEALVASAATEAAGDEDAIERLIDEDLLRASGSSRALTPPAPDAPLAAAPPQVETIIMEGELVRSSLHGELVVSQAGEEPQLEGMAAGAGTAAEGRSLRDTYLRLRDALPAIDDPDPRRRRGGLAAALLLALLLGAQLVHAHRETLATWPLFSTAVGSLYAKLGMPITPDWDVNAWQFESTSGSTDASDRILTISSSIANRSERALPYPLLHVALTDRYEEIVAGGLIEPEQYLAIRSAEGMVDAGHKFNATITIAPLAENADGYKLNVCYPLTGNDLRCATGAFRND